MTYEQNIAARLARMEAKQEHIARVVDRIEVSERDLRGRIIAIEGQERRMEGIPAQVNKNEKDNAVQEAVKRAYETFDERQAQRDRDLRQRVMMLLGIPGSLLSIAALIAIYQGVNGS